MTRAPAFLKSELPHLRCFAQTALLNPSRAHTVLRRYLRHALAQNDGEAPYHELHAFRDLHGFVEEEVRLGGPPNWSRNPGDDFVQAFSQLDLSARLGLYLMASRELSSANAAYVLSCSPQALEAVLSSALDRLLTAEQPCHAVVAAEFEELHH